MIRQPRWAGLEILIHQSIIIMSLYDAKNQNLITSFHVTTYHFSIYLMILHVKYHGYLTISDKIIRLSNSFVEHLIISLIYQVSFFINKVCNIKHKNNPSNRIRTSDLRISASIPLQSSALPTELSREGYRMQLNSTL